MYKYLVFLVLFLNAAVIFGQPQQLHTENKKALKKYEEALQAYDARRNDMAMQSIDEALEADPSFLEAYQIKAYLFLDMGQGDKAIETLKKLISLNADFFPNNYSTLAQIEYDNANYTDALIHITEFLNKEGASPEMKKKAEDLSARIKFAQQLMASPVSFKPVNLGPSINSKFKDYLPALSADEQTLIFARTLPRDTTKEVTPVNSNEDFFISKSDADKWRWAKNIGEPINSPLNEGAQTLSPDGQLFIFTGCENKVYGYGDKRKGFGSCDLFYSYKQGAFWTDPKNLGQVVNSKNWDSQPTLSSDGRTLYFISNRTGGKGGMDIWMTRIGENGQWSVPKNMSELNTERDEMSPFVHPDNATFYFSSQGHYGLGKHDLFVARKNSEGIFTNPVNLGYPINTNGDEFGLVVTAKGTKAMYASGRDGGYGDWDIYSFDLPPAAVAGKVTYMKGKVFDATTKKPLSAKFELLELSTGKTIVESYSDEMTGEFLVCLPANNNYALNCSKNGYLFFSENFALTDNKSTEPFKKDVPLSPIKSGEKVVLKNVFFETNKFDLKPESIVELNKLVDFLKSNPTLKIELSGHTDNVGDKKANQTLSENRAKAVYDYLIKSSIPADRLTFKGYGDTQPIDDNKTEKGRANNRRSEFKIL